MTVVEAMEDALFLLDALSKEHGDKSPGEEKIRLDLQAAIDLTRKHYPRTLGGDIPERNED